MFNLEQAIAHWRQEMDCGKVGAAAVLAELECHLRDDVEEQVQSGSDAEEAFRAAARRIGQANLLRNEFEKVAKKGWRRKYAVPALSGATNQPYTQDMSTADLSTKTESRWATYFKAGAFLGPAVALWAFSAIFLFPKVQEICRDAGLTNARGTEAVIFHRVMAFRRVMVFLGEHSLLLIASIIVGLALLEWRSGRWPRYRRTSIGLAVFLVNSAVLLLITTMFMLTLMAAPALFHAR